MLLGNADVMKSDWLRTLAYGAAVLITCQFLELSGLQTIVVYALSFVVLWAAQHALQHRMKTNQFAHEAAQCVQFSVTELNILHDYKEPSP